MDLQERMLQLQQLMLDIERRLDGLEQRLSPRGVCVGPDVEHQVVQLKYMLRPWLTAACPGRHANISGVDRNQVHARKGDWPRSWWKRASQTIDLRGSLSTTT